jgi:hypothetical protein
MPEEFKSSKNGSMVNVSSETPLTAPLFDYISKSCTKIYM